MPQVDKVTFIFAIGSLFCSFTIMHWVMLLFFYLPFFGSLKNVDKTVIFNVVSVRLLQFTM